MLYKLLVYLDRNGIFLIDSFTCESRDELLRIAEERKAGNSDYLTVIMAYKAIEATIV